MQVLFDVKIPKAARLRSTPSVEVETILDFLESGHTNVSFSYPDAKEAAKKISAIRSWKKHNNQSDFNVIRLSDTIYVEKIKKGAAKNG